MGNPPLIRGGDLFGDWSENFLTRTPPTVWDPGPPFGHIAISPGRIVLLGGAPGEGKTALSTQFILDATARNAGLRSLIANVEMSPERILERQLARISGVPLDRVIRRQFDALDLLRVKKGFEAIGSLVDRIAFVEAPFDLERIAGAADDFGAALIHIDYVQRIDLPGRHNGLREKMNVMVSKLREFAGAGVGILANAALTRSKDSAGRSTYDGKHLGMASFRESSELEYGCDDAFLLLRLPEDEPEGGGTTRRRVCLAHVKSRDGEPKSVELEFEGRFQRFTAAHAPAAPAPSAAASVKKAWKKGGPPDE